MKSHGIKIDINDPKFSLGEYAEDIEKIFQFAVQQALLEHKRAGNPIAVSDGKGGVVWIQPEDINTDEKELNLNHKTMNSELFYKWFERKLSLEPLPIKGSVVVAYEYKKYIGRYLYAKVVISASNADEFSFESEAEWKQEDYTQAVLNGILDVLFSYRSTPILKGAFVLKEIGWDDIDSAEIAFYRAARMATIGILNEAGYSDFE